MIRTLKSIILLSLILLSSNSFSEESYIYTQKLNEKIIYYAKHKKSYDHVLEKNKFVLYYIEKKLKENKLPSSLKFIPLIESSFNNRAVSSAHAKGIWQFMKKTGREYGLRINKKVDDRYNSYLSTDASMKYFKYLMKLFNNDLKLAVASYNCGESKVLSHIQKYHTYLIDDLRLPKETVNYVYKFTALENLYEGNLKVNGFATKNDNTVVAKNIETDVKEAKNNKIKLLPRVTFAQKYGGHYIKKSFVQNHIESISTFDLD